MIRSVARHGSPLRSIAVRRPSHFSSPYARLQPFTASVRLVHIRTSLALRPFTSIPPSSSKVDPSKPVDPVPPDLPPNRKHKAEFRPGPVKPPDGYRHPGSSSSATKTPKSSRVSTGTPSLPSSPVNSVTETTKRDFEDAQKHGILASPPPGANRLRRILHQAKELIKFYWRGLKMINANRKHVSEIKRRVKEGGAPISRWESRFLQTHREDILKLVPFVIVVILLEEIIPLIAIYAPFMLPSTCILPSQRERIEKAKRDRQLAYAEYNQSLFRRISSKNAGEIPLSTLGDGELSEAMCGLLNLSTFGFSLIRVRKVRRHMAYISRDDELLIREDMGSRLSLPEITEALQERGIMAARLSEKAQADRLKWWLTSVGDMNGDTTVSKRLFLIAKNAADS